MRQFSHLFSWIYLRQKSQIWTSQISQNAERARIKQIHNLIPNCIYLTRREHMACGITSVRIHLPTSHTLISLIDNKQRFFVLIIWKLLSLINHFLQITLKSYFIHKRINDLWNFKLWFTSSKLWRTIWWVTGRFERGLHHLSASSILVGNSRDSQPENVGLPKQRETTLQ